jgi:hypothetical protein
MITHGQSPCHRHLPEVARGGYPGPVTGPRVSGTVQPPIADRIRDPHAYPPAIRATADQHSEHPASIRGPAVHDRVGRCLGQADLHVPRRR